MSPLHHFVLLCDNYTSNDIIVIVLLSTCFVFFNKEPSMSCPNITTRCVSLSACIAHALLLSDRNVSSIQRLLMETTFDMIDGLEKG